MNMDNYNERMDKRKQAEEFISNAVGRAMGIYEIDNTEATAVLASIMNRWAHYSFCSAHNLKEEIEQYKKGQEK